MTPVLFLVAVLAGGAGEGAQDGPKYDGKTIAEWIAVFETGNFSERRKAIRTLAAAGEPAVAALAALVEGNAPTQGQALEALGNAGPAARPALPLLVRLARDRDREPPEGWTWNVPPRYLVISALREMAWAAGEITPLLDAIARDETDEKDIRLRAVSSLGGMGRAAESVLRRLARSADDGLRERAHYALAEVLPLSPREYFTEVLETDPCDPNAPDYLRQTKGIVNLGKLDSLTERVKHGLRECIEERRDPRLARVLIDIIQDQLRSTDIVWVAPSDGASSRWDRENPRESYHTLAEVARLGLELSEKGSAQWREFAVGLARMRLLQGDWEGMNRALAELGEEPIPAEDRPWLAAPPADWSPGLRARWTVADETWRRGRCGLEVRVEKDGRGLRGAHVLIKEAPKPDTSGVLRTGFMPVMSFFSPLPFGDRTFGYFGNDRERTRYAVTGEDGVARFERLPHVAVKLEVLVPTANFPEAGSSWELWMEVARGVFKRASMFPGDDVVSSNAPPAVVELEEGTTVRYPRLVVRPKYTFNVNDWARVDSGSFTLTWKRPAQAEGDEPLEYELELALSAPAGDPDLDERAPSLRAGKEIVTGESWPVGERGVGGVRLAPGNIYAIRLTARDAGGTVVFRWPLCRVWVPWEGRACDPPLVDMDLRNRMPIFHGTWWRTSVGTPDGEENLRQRVERLLEERPAAFEREYLLLGRAWLDWRDGALDRAKARFAELIASVPAENVVRATAARLAEGLAAGSPCPKRLHFVAP